MKSRGALSPVDTPRRLARRGPGIVPGPLYDSERGSQEPDRMGCCPSWNGENRVHLECEVDLESMIAVTPLGAQQ